MAPTASSPKSRCRSRRPTTGSTSSSASIRCGAAAEYANALGEQDGLLRQGARGVAAPVPHDYFLRHRQFLPREKHVAIVDGGAARARPVARLHAPLQGRRDPVPTGHPAAGGPEGPAAGLRAFMEPHDPAGAARRPGDHLSPGALSLSEPDRTRRAHPCPFRRRGAGPSRIRALRRQGHLLRPAARPLHHGGAARGDHARSTRRWARRSSIRTATRSKKAA